MPTLVSLLILAHGNYPLAYQIAEKPGDRTQLAGGTTFGLVVSHDEGATWQWVCEEAIGYTMLEQPKWYITADGTIYGASFTGMFISHDQGCTWTTAPEFRDAGAADIINTGSAMFAATARFGPVNGVWRSTDDGGTWQLLDAHSLSEFYTTVRSAPSRAQRLYVGEWWYQPRGEALYWSDDNGDTFTRVDITQTLPSVTHADGGVGPMAGSLHVFGVSPTDPDVVYAVVWSAEDPQPSYLLVTPDKGQTWTTLLKSADQINSLAVSDDGATLWAASAISLYVSRGDSGFVAQDVPSRNSCAWRYDDRLYVCGWPEADGFGAAIEALHGGSLEPFLTWRRITGAAQCPQSTIVGSTCAAYFPALRTQFPPSTLGDGGPPQQGDGGPPDGGMNNPPPGGCHCNSVEALSLWVAVVALRTRRARKNR
jgi:hypothetical protein